MSSGVVFDLEVMGSFGFAAFLSLVVVIAIGNAKKLFFPRFARRHRLCGVAYLTWLVAGVLSLFLSREARGRDTGGENSHNSNDDFHFLRDLIFDIVLGVLGTALTLSAAYDFKKAHAKVDNVASGALEETATVTFSEMIEHSFYQFLNLLQVIFLHLAPRIRGGSGEEEPSTTARLVRTTTPTSSLFIRCLLLFLPTGWWLFRGQFPVNRFSDNYTKGQKVTTITAILYRIKKYQYMFYKHFLLHGLNVSVALSELLPASSSLLVTEAGDRSGGTISGAVASTFYFRQYWIGLNAAYVMEFFLQTLVRRKFIQQKTMLFLNQWLMFFSSIAAIQLLLRHVNLYLSALSLGLMFLNRGHDVINTYLVTLVGIILAPVLQG